MNLEQSLDGVSGLQESLGSAYVADWGNGWPFTSLCVLSNMVALRIRRTVRRGTLDKIKKPTR